MSWWPLDLAQIPHRWAHTLRTSTLRRTSLSEPCWRASSVVICHGGYGTVLDAVDAAVPLIVVPFGADQHINGASVERLGIGRLIDEEALTADVLRGAARALLTDPDWQRNITGLRNAWHALPHPAAAAALVEQIGRSTDQ